MAARDGVEIHRSVCHLCHGGCGMLLHVKDGRLVAVEGDDTSSFSRGYICAKGAATPELVHHPDRLLYPLKRAGARGGSAWEQISWDRALDEIAARLDAIRATSGPETIAIGQGTARHHYFHVRRFANALGTPNWYEPGLANCFIPRVTASYLTYGGLLVGDYNGPHRARTILVWGSNAAVSNPDGKLAFRVTEALASGAYGIAIDPRRSETARFCQEWLPIRPGTDAALALAMIHVIITECLFDRRFVEDWTVGFAELAAHVGALTPTWAAEITSVPADTIVHLARRYALDRPGIIEWGVALDQNVNSLQTARAVCLLRAITGNIDLPGGEVLGDPLLGDYPFLNRALKKSAIDKRLGGSAFKLLGGYLAIVPSAHIPAVFRAMRTGDPYRVRALLLFGNNPLLTVADSRAVGEALTSLDLLVTTDMFMTPAAALSDYVLPAAFWPELDHVSELPAFAARAVVAQQKVVTVGECRPDGEILADLARRMSLPGAEMGVAEILEARLSKLGLTFAEMREKVTIDRGYTYEKHLTRGFRTSSGKVEIFSHPLQKLGYEPLPTYREPPESPRSRPDLTAEFPYVLTTGPRKAQYFHSEQRQVTRLRRRRPSPTAELNPATAAEQGIRDGDWIFVRSPRGEIRVRAAVSRRIMPGVVAVEHGWWFPEQPGGGVFEANANVLTSMAPPYDPAMGSYPLRGLLCCIRRCPPAAE